MSKQTAVEWLEEKLKENLKHIVLNGDYVLMESIFLQAKAMEREQIEQAYKKGCMDEIDKRIESCVEESCKTDYNETYKGGEQ